VPVLKNLKDKQHAKVKAWIETKQNIIVDFKDETDKIIDLVLSHATSSKTTSKDIYPNKKNPDVTNLYIPGANVAIR